VEGLAHGQHMPLEQLPEPPPPPLSLPPSLPPSLLTLSIRLREVIRARLCEALARRCDRKMRACSVSCWSNLADGGREEGGREL